MSESRLYPQTMDGGDVTKWGSYEFMQNWQNSSIVDGDQSKDVMYTSGSTGKSKVNAINSFENQKFSDYTVRRDKEGIEVSYDTGGSNT